MELHQYRVCNQCNHAHLHGNRIRCGRECRRSSLAWIEGWLGNDTFAFSGEAQLTAPAAINGNGGADTISMTAPVTLNSGAFTNVSGVQSLQLSGASAVTLGADAAAAGIHRRAGRPRGYDIAWVPDKASPVDTVNGFTEVYVDRRGAKGAWEGSSST